MSDPEKSIIDLAKGIASPPLQGGDVPARPHVVEEQPEVVTSTDDLKNTLDSLLQKSRTKQAWVSIDLPSKNLENIPALKLRLRPFKYEDERRLRSATSITESTEIIEDLINSCMQGASLRDVTLADKNFILYKLRELSYGNEYNIKAQCIACRTENQLVVRLSDLECNHADESMKNPRPVELPDSEVTVFVRHLMARDEKLFNNPEDLTENLWKVTESVGGHNDRMVIQGFLKECTARDISHLRNVIFDSDLGVDTNVKYRCNSCAAEQNIELPITEDFFSAS